VRRRRLCTGTVFKYERAVRAPALCHAMSWTQDGVRSGPSADFTSEMASTTATLRSSFFDSPVANFIRSGAGASVATSFALRRCGLAAAADANPRDASALALAWAPFSRIMGDPRVATSLTFPNLAAIDGRAVGVCGARRAASSAALRRMPISN